MEAKVKQEEIFKTLQAVDVSQFVEEKDTGDVVLSYLSWGAAWKLVKEIYPTANFNIVEFEETFIDKEGNKRIKKLPYLLTSLGIMVQVTVEIEGLSHTAHITVMDSRNRPQKLEKYETEPNKKGQKFMVQAAQMDDINNSIMRALVKALAFFGLGLDLYIKKKGNKKSRSSRNEGNIKVVFLGTTPQNKDKLRDEVNGLRFDPENKYWWKMVEETELKKLQESFKEEGEGITMKFKDMSKK